MPETEQVYDLHVTARLTVSADVTVRATSLAEARIKLATQLNSRDSPVIRDLRESASVQLSKELDPDDFGTELTGERPAQADDD